MFACVVRLNVRCAQDNCRQEVGPITTNNLFTNTSTTSADDTTISYRTTGRGPDLILLPGALAIAADLDGVAQALGTRFTVHTIERRGRGESGPQGPRYCVARECEDIEAVQRATGARFIAGHSFGGLLALEAMLARVGEVTRAHEAAITASLTGEERSQLAALLRRLARDQGLAEQSLPGIPPRHRPE